MDVPLLVLGPILMIAGSIMIAKRASLSRDNDKRFVRMFGNKGAEYSRNGTPFFYGLSGGFIAAVGLLCLIGAFIP